MEPSGAGVLHVGSEEEPAGGRALPVPGAGGRGPGAHRPAPGQEAGEDDPEGLPSEVPGNALETDRSTGVITTCDYSWIIYYFIPQIPTVMCLQNQYCVYQRQSIVTTSQRPTEFLALLFECICGTFMGPSNLIFVYQEPIRYL